MRPVLEMFMTPVIGIVCFAIILLSWFGGVRYFRSMLAGLVAIAVGSTIAWGATALGFDYSGMSGEKLAQSFSNFGFSITLPALITFFRIRILGRHSGHRDSIRHLRSGGSTRQRSIAQGSLAVACFFANVELMMSGTGTARSSRVSLSLRRNLTVKVWSSAATNWSGCSIVTTEFKRFGPHRTLQKN
jgi:hypothetical protein